MRTSPSSRRAATRLAVSMVTAGVMLGVGGCGLFGGEKVALIGDSITALSKDTLEKTLGDYSVSSAGRFGARVDEMHGEADRLARDHPAKVVINLGTNDAIQKVPPATTRQHLEQMIRQFDGASCIALVTIDEELTVYGTPRRADAAALNVQIRQIAAATPSLKIIDWNKIVADHGGILAVTTDGVHPNDAGKLLLAEGYKATLDAC